MGSVAALEARLSEKRAEELIGMLPLSAGVWKLAAETDDCDAFAKEASLAASPSVLHEHARKVGDYAAWTAAVGRPPLPAAPPALGWPAPLLGHESVPGCKLAPRCG